MKRWHFWAGLIISVMFLYLALRGLNLQTIWNSITSANLIWLLPGILVYFAAVMVRAWRWQYLLYPVQEISLLKMFPVIVIGYMGNNIYPARAGELLSAVLLKRKHQIAVSASLATILAQRIFDGIVMLGFLFLNLFQIGKLNIQSGFLNVLRTLAFWGSLVFIGLLLIFLVMAAFPVKSHAIIQKIIWVVFPQKWQSGAEQVIRRFMLGLGALQTPRDVITVTIMSIIIWLIEALFYWFVMLAFPFRVSFFTLMLLLGVVNLATTLPSAPGYVGTFDAMSIAFLTAMGVSSALSAGYTVVLHAALWLPITLVGLFFFAREGLKWSEGLQSHHATGEKEI